MARLVVMYKKPADAAAFDTYYFGTHVPIAKKIPGLQRYEVSKGAIMTPQGPSGYHLVATLHFADMKSIMAAFASAEGGATAADLANFAQAGVEMVMFEDAQV
jgi:uncharacterized protein (TIGR02118 family)